MEQTTSASFTTVSWANNSNIYEVNLRQYTKEGTFKAFMKEMPRLRDMGVEILWFMPITPISQEKRLSSLGSYYACSSYVQTNPEFGSIEDFKTLVAAAHELGFKVIIDWVANHTGYDHEWTRAHPEFYRRNLEGHFYDANGWEDVIDLNYDNEALWTKMIESMQFWLNTCDIDGFRCDMAMLVPLNFWKQARRQLDQPKKLFWLAECEDIPYHEAFDATYTWKWLHRMEAYYRRETGMGGLDEVLDFYSSMFPPTALRAFFTSNHDENSHSGSEYERMGPAALPFAVLSCTWNSIPLIYSGQELPNKKRLKFFDKDFIEWTDHCALHSFYAVLLKLRKSNSALNTGDEQVVTQRIHTDAQQHVFAFIRRHQQTGHEVLVLLNLSDEDKPALRLLRDDITGDFTDAFSGSSMSFNAETTLSMKKWEYLVFAR